jgi:WD40 repeat protein
VHSPVEFSPLGDFFVSLRNNEIQIVELNTGIVQEVVSETILADGFEFAPNSQRYAAYYDNSILIFDYNKKVFEFELSSDLYLQDYYKSELRSIRFNSSGDKVACLLADGEIVIWSLVDSVATIVMSYQSKAMGLYWGEVLVAVGRNTLEFFKEDGTSHCYNKNAQTEAYHELTSETNGLVNHLANTWKHKYAWPVSWGEPKPK